MRKERDLIVHLVNHSGRERLGGYHYPVTEYIPEIRDIRIDLRLGAAPLRVIELPDNRPIQTEAHGHYLSFISPPLNAMQSFFVPGYFPQ